VEPLGPDGCFSELKELSVALVCVLVHRPYCDDTPWYRYFQFQVRMGTVINFAYAGLPRIAWYVPENPTTSKVRVSVRKFCTSRM
jgi:hypothetical protein